jgi:hypothetical protein
LQQQNGVSRCAVGSVSGVVLDSHGMTQNGQMLGAQFAKCQIDALAARNLSGVSPTLSVENLDGPRYLAGAR